MNALAIIEAASAEGLVVGLVPGGSLKASGEQKVVDRWRPLLKQHKAEIINLLNGEPGRVVQTTRPFPEWCRTVCPGCESPPLPNEGGITSCPALENTTRPTLPRWCNTRCDHYHRLELPGLGAVEWCCFEQDETHWRRARINSMSECPLQEAE